MEEPKRVQSPGGTSEAFSKVRHTYHESDELRLSADQFDKPGVEKRDVASGEICHLDLTQRYESVQSAIRLIQQLEHWTGLLLHFGSPSEFDQSILRFVEEARRHPIHPLRHDGAGRVSDVVNLFLVPSLLDVIAQVCRVV
jgi:hypothetical protein